ncbi:MAG: hypothetical protein IJO03_04080 [Clostridia bacterium]|nr:hypothetical protein [Clostridia bacterium]
MDNIKRFDIAAQSLSGRLTRIFTSLDDCDKQRIREIRLRSRRPVAVITDTGTEFISRSGRLTQVYTDLMLRTDEREIEEIFKRLCGYSVHSFRDAINRGYITIAGGHRAGVAGTAVCENGRVTAVRDICAVNLRIAREIKGAANEIYRSEFADGLKSVIIAGPPSSGKTTVLRDLVRCLSGADRGYIYKTFVCDERGEIAACVSGVEQNDMGINSDIITSYPKAEGIMIGLRSFSPDIIVCDEIATDEEAAAVEAGVNSGVCFALSIHARDERELKTKPVLNRLLLTGAFSSVILLSGRQVGKTEKIFSSGDILA